VASNVSAQLGGGDEAVPVGDGLVGDELVGDELVGDELLVDMDEESVGTPPTAASGFAEQAATAPSAATAARARATTVGRCGTVRRYPRPVCSLAMPRPVVLDVDTGVDDALALLLAARHPELDLRAVTCVGGNAPLDLVVANTLTVLDAVGRADVPVAAGSARPLLEEPAHARHVHGEDGLGDLDWPKSSRRPDPRHAVELLRDVLRAADQPVTLVTLAPLTNTALLLRTYPDVAARLSRVVVMGGAANVGNATASAEFNVFHDPEAAAIALDAAADLRLDVTLYGLDVFYEPTVTAAQAADLTRRSDPGARLGGLLAGFQCDRFGEPATIGDAGAVCAVLEPEGLHTERLPIRVELGGSWSRGRTVVDRRSWAGDMSHDPHGRSPVEVDVGLQVDGPRYASLWLQTVGGP
jgi:pyrimidine-specific ribonucleoside hydrolase